MNSYIADKLYDRIEKKGVVCVGLDTAYSYVPEYIKKNNNLTDAIFEFNKDIIDATKDYAACFKVQIAYYESYGLDGLLAYKKTLQYLRENDEIIIADIKRGDIAATAKMYAKAHFEGDFEADFITLSPYMGFDSIEPYMEYLNNGNKGVFSLVRTSNKGAEDIEYLDTKDGRKVYEAVADGLYDMGKDIKGKCGYSAIGAVMGCTHVEEGKMLREKYKNMFFLIPGYGAQGGKAEGCCSLFK